MKPWFVYTLSDPRTNQVRYVGKTENVRKRFNEHISKSQNQADTHRARWINKLVKLGLTPLMDVVANGVGDAWIEAEQFWIAFYNAAGAKLTNATIGGDGTPGLIVSLNKVCKKCRYPFVAHSSKAEYCDLCCTFKCKNCGRNFKTRDYSRKNRKPLYCSSKCYGEGKIPTSRECRVCRKTFYAKSHKVDCCYQCKLDDSREDAMKLAKRIDLTVETRAWLNQVATKYHYMHRPVHVRASPFGWRIKFDDQMTMPDGKPCGFIMFASIHFVRLKGEFGYPGLPTKWQVLSLARLWVHDDLPKFAATCIIGKAHRLIQARWLEVHPPAHLDEPYHITKVISYADNEYHKGTIYEAANYRVSGVTTSKRRHADSPLSDMDGHKLTRYIYDLPEPRWRAEVPYQIPMFEGVPARCHLN